MILTVKLKSYIHYNVLFLRRNFIFPLIFLVINVAEGYSYHYLLNYPESVDWQSRNLSEFLVSESIDIYFTPDTKSNVKVFQKQGLSSVTGFKNISQLNIDVILEKNDITYLYWINTINCTNFELVCNLTDIRFVQYSFLIIQRLGSIFKTGKSHIINQMNLFSYFILGKDSFIHSISISGMPDKLERPIEWPGIYLLTLFIIMGCVMLNYRELNSSYHYIVTNSAHVTLKLMSLLLVYNIVGVVCHIGIVIMFTCHKDNNILSKVEPMQLFQAFTLIYNTGLATAFFLVFISGDIFIAIFGYAILIYPQILYIICYGNTIGTSLRFKYGSMISPFFAMAWILIIMEEFESFDVSTTKLNIMEDFRNSQFSILTNVIMCGIYFFVFTLIIISYSNINISFLKRKKRISKLSTRSSSGLKKSQKSEYDALFEETTSENSIIVSNTMSASDKNLYNKMRSKGTNQSLPTTSPSRSAIPSMLSTISPLDSTRKRSICLATKKLSKIFKTHNRDIIALKNFNMTANKNCVTAIIGANGSGKTTLVDILSGRERPNQGSIRVENDIITNVKYSRGFSKISVFTDSINSFQYLTMLEFLKFILIIEHVTVDFSNSDLTIKSLSSILQLDEYFNMKLSFCPTVVIRLVEILGTFLLNTPIVILDEPYKNLDYRNKQNVNNLLSNRKSIQSIIVTTNKATNIETCADKVILILNGKSVFQSSVSALRHNIRLGYKMECTMSENSGDYSLIMFIKSIYPKITYESSLGHVIQFNIPQEMRYDLETIIANVNSNAEKCGISKLSISRLDFNTYFLKLSEKIIFSNLTFNEKAKMFELPTYYFELLPKNENFWKLYFQHFGLIFMYNVTKLYRFPNQTTFSVMGPFMGLIFFSLLSLVAKGTLIYWNEMPSDFTNEILVGHENLTEKHQIVMNEILQDFLFDFKPTNIVKDINFQGFVLILRNRSLFLNMDKNRSNRIAIFFGTNKKGLFSIDLFSNFENYLARCYAILQNYYQKPLYLLNFGNNETLSKYGINSLSHNINNVFLLRLVYLTIVVFASNLFRNRMKITVKSQDRTISTFTAHYTLCFLPKYTADIVVLFVFNGFMILFMFALDDFRITSQPGDVNSLVLMLLMYGVTDIMFKTLIGRSLNYSPSTIFGFMVLDIGSVVAFTSTSAFTYKLLLKNYGFNAGFKCSNLKSFFDFILMILVPAVNLNNGFSMYLGNRSWNIYQETCDALFQQRLTSDNNSLSLGLIGLIFTMQFSVCLSFLLVLNHPIFSNWKFTDLLSKKHKNDNISGNLSSESKLSLSDTSQVIFDNVTYCENGIPKLHHVNWKVARNTVSLILGPNDSGKTALVELILGYKVPSSGRIYLQNHLLRGHRTQWWRFSVSYSPQEPTVFEELTVYELLLFWAKIRCLPVHSRNFIIQSIIKDLGLVNDTNKLAKNLSNMNMKKMNICAALLGFPDLIILDDPLSNLDTVSQIQVVNLLAEAKNHLSTLIITASEVNNLFKITDNVIILNRYNIEYQGRWKDLPDNILIGYFLTLVFDDCGTSSDIRASTLEERLKPTFPEIKMILNNDNAIIFFIPAKDKVNVEFTFYVIEMEKLLSVSLNIVQYFITFNFMIL